MATINVFEGARRLAFVLKVVWLIGVAGVVTFIESARIHYSLLFAIGGWIALSVVQAAVGWIARGFVGIPRGHDHRPDAL